MAAWSDVLSFPLPSIPAHKRSSPAPLTEHTEKLQAADIECNKLIRKAIRRRKLVRDVGHRLGGNEEGRAGGVTGREVVWMGGI